MTNDGAFHKQEENFPGSDPRHRRLSAFATCLLHCGLLVCASVSWNSLAGTPVWAQGPSPRYGLPPLVQSPDAFLVESLIADGLPSIAVNLCKSRLSLHGPETDPHVQWLMLAMHSEAAAMLQNQDFSDGPGGLDEILRSLETRSQTAIGHRRELWVRWKKSWLQWLVQQRALAAYLAVPSRESLREWIVGSIRNSLDEVEQLELEVRKMPSTRGSEVTNEQRLDLRGSLDLLKADLLHQRSQCYPPGSDDRMAAASEMLRSLDAALSRLPGDWTHRPALSIARAKAQVQLQQYGAALTSLETLWKQLQETDSPSAQSVQYQRAMAAVAVRAGRELGRWEDVAGWLARGGGPNATPELALEHFASEIQRGGDSSAEQALQLKKEIGARFGPYWEQRAEAFLVANGGLDRDSNPSTGPKGSASLEVLRIEVRQLLAAKRWSDAINKLQQAELAATQEKLDNVAFAFAMQRAAVFESNGQSAEAANAFFQAATEHSNQPQSPAASLMSAWLIRPQGNKASPTNTNSSILYRDRLLETARRWPESDAAAQAIDWLERDALARDQLAPVLDVWTARVASSSQFERGLARYAFATTLLQDDWIEASPFQEPSVRDALAHLQKELIEQSPEIDRDRLAQALPFLAQERRWRVPVLSGDGSTPFGMAAALVSGPVSALQDPDAIRSLLAPWQNDPLGRIGWLWTSCELRSAVLLSRNQNPSGDELRSIELLNRQLHEEVEAAKGYPFGPTIMARLKRSIRFHEILSGSEKGDATQRFAALEKERDANKKSAWWLYRVARTMQMDSDMRQESMAKYRQLAIGFPAGSEPWFEMRARTTQTMRWLGDTTAADQLRDLVLATYPAAEPVWLPRMNGN